MADLSGNRQAIETCREEMDQGMIQNFSVDIKEPGLLTGVQLIGGERIVFADYDRASLIRQVATTIAFATGTRWYINVPMAREVIKVVKEHG